LAEERENNQRKITKIAIDYLGCKLNMAEVEHLAAELASVGYEVVARADDADIYVLNTCTLTHVADRKSRHMLRMAHRRNPAAKLVATGCYAERAPEELAGIGGVALVLNNADKMDLADKLAENGLGSGENHQLGVSSGVGKTTRSFVKIEDGCNLFCTYCIVPWVRRGQKSLPPDDIISEIKQKVALGYREIVLTGTRVGAYSYEDTDLRRLLERILNETETARLRLSSLQPAEITPELLWLWRDKRLCPHFHMSLQSGSPAVLERMNRRYTTSEYLEAVKLVRESVPDVAVSTDIIVGFPSETDKEFSESYELCQRIGFARIHVFPYSARQGTMATKMTGQVTDKLKRERINLMLELAEESMKKYDESFIGRETSVLWEKLEKGRWSGLTGNYIRVYAEHAEELTNQLLPVILGEPCGDGLWGKLI